MTESDRSQRSLRRARYVAVAALIGLGVVLGLALWFPGRDPYGFLAAGTPWAVPDLRACQAIPGLPGPEDLEVDSVASRLLVSSQERREMAWPTGAIYTVPLTGSAKPFALQLASRDGCSFHPHGMSLVTDPAGQRFLYVVNHHDEEDALPGAGCGLGAEGTGRPSSVEVFRVETYRLVFVRRLVDREALTNPNDLVALKDGSVWATNPTPSVLGGALEALTHSNHGSSLVRFRCGTTPGPGCAGDWEIALQLGAYLNGIAYREATAELFVAATLEDEIYRVTVGPDQLYGPERLSRNGRGLEKIRGPDNLSWGDDQSLLVAGHPDLRRFLQHSHARTSASPSAVWRISTAPGGEERLLLRDDGGTMSAASVAVVAGNELIVGQVFDPFVLRCPLSSAAAGARGEEAWR